MKYTDRKSVGVTSFLASCSRTFSDLRELTGESVSERLRDMPAGLRRSLSRLIRVSLSDLIDTRSPSVSIIPDDILALDDDSMRRLSDDEIVRFFDWLIELNTEIEQCEIKRLAALSDAAFHLDPFSRSFFRTFFALNNQRVYLTAQGDTVNLITARRGWGRVIARFEDCRYDLLPLPLPCYLFSAEIELLPDGRIDISLLADTHFGAEEYCSRLLRGDGWQEVHFTCSRLRAEPLYCDHAAAMRLAGYSRVELIRIASDELCDKARIVGTDALSASERALLPMSQLLVFAFGIKDCNDRDCRGDLLASSLEPLGNRYAMSNFAALLDDCGCDILGKLLTAAGDHAADDDDKAAMRSAEIFAYALDECIANGSARDALRRISDMYLSVDIPCADDPRTRTLRDIARALCDCAAPHLQRLGFIGSFPHFRRENELGMDYISFILKEKYDHPRHEIMTYTASIAAAHLSHRRYGQSAADTSDASDCRAEYHDISSYGEMASVDDGEVLEFNASLHEQTDVPISPEQERRISEYLSFAGMQFDSGYIPAAYRRRRMRAAGHLGHFARAFSDCLPIGVIAAIVILLFCLLSDRIVATAGTSILSAVSFGVILTVVCSIIRCIILSRRLWRY